ncbi:MAG TPA: type II secretion system protein M [Steroidobacteraceae bacterium]|nr:type II secretion system protein M [Steroidobacteraceae bacterium]
MMEQVLRRYSRLGEREQRVVLLGGVAALLILIAAIVMPLQTSVDAAAQRIEQKRSDLSWLQSLGPQLGALRASTPAPLHESLVVLVARTARDAGIGMSLVGSAPSANGGLNVRFERAPFDALVTWLSQLADRYGVQAESATIEAAQAPGTVDATLVLRTH